MSESIDKMTESVFLAWESQGNTAIAGTFKVLQDWRTYQ